jgi:hypothetical protein
MTSDGLLDTTVTNTLDAYIVIFNALRVECTKQHNSGHIQILSSPSTI